MDTQQELTLTFIAVGRREIFFEYEVVKKISLKSSTLTSLASLRS